MSESRPLFRIALISDVHVDMAASAKLYRKFNISRFFSDIKKFDIPVDAVAVPGDMTSRGTEKNWRYFEKYFRKNPAKKTILCVGNHDTWGDEGYQVCFQRYLRYNEKITGHTGEKSYFSEDFGCCKVICAGNEEASGCSAVITDAQLEWLNGELDTAEKKPCFVLCHQSLNQKHGLPRTWEKKEDPSRPPEEGGVGERSRELEEILKKHVNVFYISGHSHMGLCSVDNIKTNGWSSFEEDDGVHLINMPCYTNPNHHGEINSPGIGFVVDVFEDSVILTPRNHIKRKWLDYAKVVYRLK